MSYIRIKLNLENTELLIQFRNETEKLTFDYYNAKEIYLSEDLNETLLTPFGLRFLKNQIFLMWIYEMARRGDSIFRIRTYELFKIYYLVKKKFRRTTIKLTLTSQNHQKGTIKCFYKKNQ